MPLIDIRTNQKLTREEKRLLTRKLTSAFASSSNVEVSKAIQYSIEDGIYMDFQGNDDVLTASLVLNMSPYIPESDHFHDHEKIIQALKL